MEFDALFKQKNSDKLDKEEYYFECCAGLGDTLLTCGYLYALERKYQSHIRLLVKPSHAFIPEMYKIDDYLVIGKDISVDFIKRNAKRKPKRGAVYYAHPCKHPELWSFFEPLYNFHLEIRFMKWFKQFLALADNTEFTEPECYPVLSEKTRKKCIQYGGVDKIVVFSPEATSVPLLPYYFWEDMAEKLNEEGLTVISNVIDPRNTVRGTHYLELSPSDAVALGKECHSVYSIRSGYCDLLFKKGKNLHIYYPEYSSFFMYSMKEMFSGYCIDEQFAFWE